MEYQCERQEVIQRPGGKLGHAKDSARRLSEENQRGIEGAGGAEGKRGFAARAQEAQRRKRKEKDHAKIGGGENNESMVQRPGTLVVRILFLVTGPQHR